MTRAAVGLGSNLGDRPANLRRALEGIRALGDVVAVSSVYETAPVGGPEQGRYLNAVAVVETDLDPGALLEGCLALERALGRRRRERWGPRSIDLDVLLYGDTAVDRPGLTVPHPRMKERRFVLEPLAEAWPDARLPDGTAVSDLLEAVAGQDVVRFAPARGMSYLAVFLATGLAAVALWLLIDAVIGRL
jgi:2-amino-4-hydroxy-6-hydroxymethyldihydropteridine diphosphokinase